MISLILPKLIRSVARDGIWTFNDWLATSPNRLFFPNDTRQGRDLQARTCRNSNRLRRFFLGSVFFSKKIYFFSCSETQAAEPCPPPPQETCFFFSAFPP